MRRARCTSLTGAIRRHEEPDLRVGSALGEPERKDVAAGGNEVEVGRGARLGRLHIGEVVDA